ncbi:MerR family DNA-binding protein [Paracoccaceae bacterium]|nr:MerR family DNA-binding protein [Paracoccaceae bacterium]
MNISQAAKLSGLSVKTVRYYADIKMVEPVRNIQSGYRSYSNDDVAKLNFIGKARRFNFSIEECRELLSFYQDKNRSSKEVKKLTLAKIASIDEKLKEFHSLRDELSHLVYCCNGDDRPSCPILDELSKR